MLDEILDSLKTQAAPQLMQRIGLNEQQTHGSLQAATASVKQVVTGGDGFGADDLLNLFSPAKNTAGADGILNAIAQVFNGKLTNEVGLNAQQSSGVQGIVLPLLMDLLGSKVGGNAGNLQGLLNAFTGGGGGLADAASGLLRGLFK